MEEQEKREKPPSPYDLNQKLRDLYQAIPPLSTEDEIDAFAENEGINIREQLTLDQIKKLLDFSAHRLYQRQHSEMKAALIEKLSNLLSHALVTLPCRVHITNEFMSAYDSGMGASELDEKDNIFPSTHQLLDLHDESPGIFHPSMAMEIERNLYRSALEINRITTRNATKEQINYMIKAQTNVGKRITLLQQWREAYINKYNDEP